MTKYPPREYPKMMPRVGPESNAVNKIALNFSYE